MHRMQLDGRHVLTPYICKGLSGCSLRQSNAGCMHSTALCVNDTLQWDHYIDEIQVDWPKFTGINKDLYSNAAGVICRSQNDMDVALYERGQQLLDQALQKQKQAGTFKELLPATTANLPEIDRFERAMQQKEKQKLVEKHKTVVMKQKDGDSLAISYTPAILKFSIKSSISTTLYFKDIPCLAVCSKSFWKLIERLKTCDESIHTPALSQKDLQDFLLFAVLGMW